MLIVMSTGALAALNPASVVARFAGTEAFAAPLTLSLQVKLPWREAGLPNHLDDKVDSDQ